jgi:DNA-binding NtrC family response regulator/CHASE2 domain-containing sensor protein
MSNKPILSRLASSTTVQAVLIGLLSTLLAWTCWQAAPSTVTALDWSSYDAWLRLRKPISVSPLLVVITPDPSSEGRFAAGAWDHASLARVITALARAGAAVLGLEVPIGDPSSPGRGGATGDAMLSEATKSGSAVTYPFSALSIRLSPGDDGGHPFPETLPGTVHPSWPTVTPDQVVGWWSANSLERPLPAVAHQARGLGHTFAPADEDGVVRRLPLYVILGDRAVPAFALAVAAGFWNIGPEQVTINPGEAVIFQDARLPDGRTATISIPIDGRGQVLLNDAGGDLARTFTPLPFMTLWSAIEDGDTERLREWLGGKIVLILPAPPSPGGASARTPLTRQATNGLIQANLLNTLVTEQSVREAPPAAAIILALGLAGLAAWLLLTMRSWRGAAAVAALAASFAGVVWLAPPLAGWVLPSFLPLSALLVASGCATIWTQVAAGHRLRRLEDEIVMVQHELATVREALVCHESNVEELEEDVAAARAGVTRLDAKGTKGNKTVPLIRSAEALRQQLAEAKAQEAATRRRLQELEDQLKGLRSVTTEAEALGDSEQERLRQECEQMGILTRDPVVLGVFRDLKKGARSPLAVLILGEPGTGKELFARAVHRLGLRADQPFVPVNMAAIPAELFESELFGHVKGSFTGALGDRKGYFEQAHRGTIFLDEIGDLRLEHQGKLLRVLQEKTFHAVGATRPIVVDVRVVAATNKDLQRGVAEGWFREDLYSRLKGIVLRLPPLRERRLDIPLLAERFVAEAAVQVGCDGLRLSEQGLAALHAHPWNGNLRELRQCLEQAVALADGSVITAQDLRLTPDALRGVRAGPAAPALLKDPGSDQAVLECLRQHEFDMQEAARALGWDRSTVTQRLKGMGFQALVESQGDHPKAALALAGDPALVRTVQLKLLDYYQHLLSTIQAFKSADEAIAACKKRFKNLPDRHFRSVKILIRQHFAR